MEVQQVVSAELAENPLAVLQKKVLPVFSHSFLLTTDS